MGKTHVRGVRQECLVESLVTIQAIGAHLLTLVLSRLQAMDDLLVDEVCAELVVTAVMPGGEDLFTEDETPGGVLLLASPPLCVLLTPGDGVHHVLPAAAQSPHLQHSLPC